MSSRSLYACLCIILGTNHPGLSLYLIRWTTDCDHVFLLMHHLSVMRTCRELEKNGILRDVKKKKNN